MLLENQIFAYAKTKTQISFAVTTKLISAFIFAIQVVQSLFYLNPKFQASSYLLWLYSQVCVRPGWKSRRQLFSQRGSNVLVFPSAILTTQVSNARPMVLFLCKWLVNSVDSTDFIPKRDRTA